MRRERFTPVWGAWCCRTWSCGTWSCGIWCSIARSRVRLRDQAPAERQGRPQQHQASEHMSKSIRRHDATIRRAGCASHRHPARCAVKPLHQLRPSINHFQRELNLPRRSRCLADDAEAAPAQNVRRQSEIHDVEEFRPEFERLQLSAPAMPERSAAESS